MPPVRPAARSGAVPAPLIFMGSALSQYVGAGLAVSLFALMPSMTVAWWRVLVGGLVLLTWRRPWRHPWSRSVLVSAAVFGVATATMNVIFYGAIARLPLGTSVSLEFLGPVVVALVTGRGWRPRVAAGLALAGVISISGLGVDVGDPVQRAGLLLALGAGAAWACYILLGRRVASAGSGLDSLAVGMACGALAYAPLGIPTAGAALTSGTALAMVAGVGILSTALPYGLEQIALERLSADAFALLSSLLPATSLLIGVVMLHQLPNAGELAGLVLISAAVALASLRGR